MMLLILFDLKRCEIGGEKATDLIMVNKKENMVYTGFVEGENKTYRCSQEMGRSRKWRKALGNKWDYLLVGTTIIVSVKDL